MLRELQLEQDQYVQRLGHDYLSFFILDGLLTQFHSQNLSQHMLYFSGILRGNHLLRLITST